MALAYRLGGVPDCVAHQTASARTENVELPLALLGGAVRLRVHDASKYGIPFLPEKTRKAVCVPSRKPIVYGYGRLTTAVRSKLSADQEGEESTDADSQSNKLNFESQSDLFPRWVIPWDGKTVTLTMMAFGGSFLLAGLSLSVVKSILGFNQWKFLDLDEQALLIFVNQLLQTIAGITVLNLSISKYKPVPDDLFRYDLQNPFDISSGWLVWGLVGIVIGAAAVLLAGVITTTLNGQPLPREEQDALLRLLPFIGVSKSSTALLLAVTGVLAPYLEETAFRGYLMASLTKWVPTSASVFISAITFACAHFTPGELPQLFALGVVLGFSYAKTRNLLTPILIHALWNSGVIILLTFLRSQGYNIQELI